MKMVMKKQVYILVLSLSKRRQALCIVLLFIKFAGFSQTIPPSFINYQKVLFDVNAANPNAPLSNQSFTTFVNINDELGNLLYREEHFASTDANGLITVKMGDGLYTAGSITNFNQINWGVGKYYLVVDFVINGTTSSTAPEQLVTVPYSYFAGRAGNGMTAVADNGNGTLTFTYANGQTYVTPALSGIQGAVGPAGAQGVPGPQGLAGTNGQNALIKTTTEPAGANCAVGGTKIETGLDANINGVLDAGEVNSSQTKYVCNGTNATGGSDNGAHMQVFTAGTYTWTAPTGVTSVIIELWGAGGGGATSNASNFGINGCGGSAGGYGKGSVNVVSGQSYSVTVGTGGTSCPFGNPCNGGNGGDSSFSTLIISNGGQGGLANGVSGLGGSSNAMISCIGGNGGNGGTTSFGPSGKVSCINMNYGNGGIGSKGASDIGQNGLVIIYY
jgi:hypothetical protein